MSSTNAVLQRLRKILALAEGGIEGERENAKAHLETLLRHHGLSIADLTSPELAEVTFYEFAVEGLFEERLVRQIVAAVTDQVEVKTFLRTGKRGLRAYRLTAAQCAEVTLIYEVTRRALARELECTYKAFVQVNELYPSTPDESDQAFPGDRSTEELVQLFSRMTTMDRTPIHKALE
jgi:Protein of unknown function (DUF2786).